MTAPDLIRRKAAFARALAASARDLDRQLVDRYTATRPSSPPAPLPLPEVSADGSCEPPHLAWVDALGVAIEPSPEAWQAAFAYLYGRPGGEEYVRALEVL